ncbi:hypothetical protein [Allopusillimonas ginsengisoli]|uniref:hypothetical protein n=1 Tax=Allopusillimonas ginsengisoli TaxID=453575 RepID=UPI001ADB78DB|nr:hypothetical protein [Allopusillimonas ginsengisoli]
MFFIIVGILAIALIVVAFMILSESPIGSIVSLALAIVVGVGGVYTYPKVIIKLREAEGQAQLAQATANRRIQVEEATAARDSAVMLAEAEVSRAKGVAEANRIVAEGLGGPEGYLRYLYIEGLKQAQNAGAQIIYVPTEAGLPILEAGRFK